MMLSEYWTELVSILATMLPLSSILSVCSFELEFSA